MEQIYIQFTSLNHSTTLDTSNHNLHHTIQLGQFYNPEIENYPLTIQSTRTTHYASMFCIIMSLETIT